MGETRILAALALAGALLIGPVGNAGAAPGFSRVDGLSAIEFVQDKQKPETVKQTVKRAGTSHADHA